MTRRRNLWGLALAFVSLGASNSPMADRIGGSHSSSVAEAATHGSASPVAEAPSRASDSPVADAAMRGDVSTVRQLIRDGADANAPQGDGMTGLHWAARLGSLDVVDVLVAAGAHVEARTRNGEYRPLHLAAREGHGAMVGRLLAAGADPGARTTSSDVTPLHLAARSGSVPALRHLLNAGGELEDRAGAFGQTALIFAAGFGRLDAVRFLVERGAILETREHALHLPSRYAIDRAAQAARDAVLATFREQAQDPTTWQPTPRQVQAAAEAARAVQDQSPEDALGQPVTPSEDTSLRPLSYRDLVGHQGGLSALHHGVREGFRDIVMLLLDAGADVDQRTRGEEATPLLLAMINGHFDLGLELLDRGADATLADAAGATPLFAVVNTQWAPRARYPQQQAHLRQASQYMDVMVRLLEAGADPNARLERHLWYMSYNFDLLSVDTGGATPFWRAAYALDVPAMRLLMSYGADPETPTRKPAESGGGYGPEAGFDGDPSGLEAVPVGGPGVYPIHAATGVGYGYRHAANAHHTVPNGWLEAVRFLVDEAGVDVNARDHEGYNAVHHAASRGDDEVIRFLVERGADVTAIARTGHSTVDMANSPNRHAGGGNRLDPFPTTIALLEGLGARKRLSCEGCDD